MRPTDDRAAGAYAVIKDDAPDIAGRAVNILV